MNPCNFRLGTFLIQHAETLQKNIFRQITIVWVKYWQNLSFLKDHFFYGNELDEDMIEGTHNIRLYFFLSKK